MTEERRNQKENGDFSPRSDSSKQSKERGGEASSRGGPDLEMLERLVATGHSDAEIVHILGINRTTLFRWKKRPEVKAIYEAGRNALVSQIEKSLFRRALGGETVEEEYRVQEVKKKSGKVVKKPVLVKEIRKTLAPDTLALIFALKNLAPEDWKDKHEYAGERVIEIALTDVKTKEDVDRIRAILQARKAQLLAQGHGAAQSDPKGLLEPPPGSNGDSGKRKSDA